MANLKLLVIKNYMANTWCEYICMWDLFDDRKLATGIIADIN
ncbi:hypothetical protein [Mucilaginibacter sp. SMC90]|nr:hypothetical protein [Mucilaginibacter sp. SMC90]